MMLIGTYLIALVVGGAPHPAATAPDGQDKEVLMQRFVAAQSRYHEMRNYALNVKMRSYKGHVGGAPVDTASSYFLRDGERMYSRSMGVVMVQDARCRVVVNEGEHSIMVADRMTLADPLNMFKSDEWRATVLDAGSTVRGELTEGWFTLGAAMFERVSYTIDASGYLRSLELFYREALPENDRPDSPVFKPRLRFDLSVPVPFNAKKEADRFDTGAYLVWQGKAPKSRNKDYTVFDTRLP